MPRFDRLEFEQGPASRPEAVGEEPVRDASYWLHEADQERRRGLHESALRYYSRGLEMEKSLVLGWVGQVQMLVALEEYPEADLWARKALELFRNQPDLLAARAQALCRRGDFRQAHALSDASLAQEGQSAYRWMARGELLVAEKENVDRHCFDKAVQADPDWLVPLEIGLIYLHYGQPARALQRVRQALEKASDSPYCWYVQGWCQEELGLDRNARESLGQCLDLFPGHALALRRLQQLERRGWSPLRTLRRWLGRN